MSLYLHYLKSELGKYPGGKLIRKRGHDTVKEDVRRSIHRNV